MRMSWWLRLGVSAVVFGCGGDRVDRQALVADSLAASESALQTATLLEPVRTVGAAEVEFAVDAAERAEREDVRRYAQVVAADHRAVATVLDSVVRTLAVTAEPSMSARDLEAAVRTAHSGLDALSGSDFDLAFIRAEVESHRLLVDRLDQEVIPDTRGAELREMLSQIRTMTAAHLTRARQILADLLGQAPLSRS